MYKIQTLNKISSIGLDVLPRERFTIADTEENPDAILLRSFKMHDMELPPSLKAIGRAGAGVNNIPIEKCTEKGIVVFNTPGGNANAVKELVMASLLISSRGIVEGINWVNTQQNTTDLAKVVEKEKSRFAGNEIAGKKLGIIGLGAIGVLVANAALDMGMEVLGVDPYISVDAAWHLHSNVVRSNSYDELADCDYITIHTPFIPETKHMINAATMEKLKTGVKILNFARGELVSKEDLKTAIDSGKVGKYITDFPEEDLVRLPNVICIPHLGASTEESEENCAKMAANEVKDFLEKGTILNSVNFPNCQLTFKSKNRLCIAHKNIPNMIASFLEILSETGTNVDDMINKSRDGIAYTLIDFSDTVDPSIVEKIKNVHDVIFVRLLQK